MKYVLLTTKDWFFAPDGQQYKAVFGEISTEDPLLQVGNTTIPASQVVTIIKTDHVNFRNEVRGVEFEGKIIPNETEGTRIYDARPDDEKPVKGK